jgi:hypothetical protein
MQGTRPLWHIVRIAHPAQGRRGCHFFFELRERFALLPGFEQGSVGVARADHVPTNAALAQFVAPGAREGADRRLGGAVTRWRQSP